MPSWVLYSESKWEKNFNLELEYTNVVIITLNLKQSDKSERQRVTDQMVEIAKRIKEDDVDGFVLPDADMLSSDEVYYF